MWDWPETPEPRRRVGGLGHRVWALAAGMVSGEAVCGALSWMVWGRVGLLAVLFGMCGGSVGVLTWLVRGRSRWMDRAALRGLSARVALVHVVVWAGLWVAAGVPDTLLGAWVVLGAVAVGLLFGLGSLVVTLCVGDVVAMIFAPFTDELKPPRWRRR